MVKDDRIKLILQVFGLDAQKEKLAEEQRELRNAINDGDKYCVADEIADNLVVISQMMEHFGITEDEVEARIRYKLNRTMERIGSKYYEHPPDDKEKPGN